MGPRNKIIRFKKTKSGMVRCGRVSVVVYLSFFDRGLSFKWCVASLRSLASVAFLFGGKLGLLFGPVGFPGNRPLTMEKNFVIRRGENKKRVISRTMRYTSRRILNKYLS